MLGFCVVGVPVVATPSEGRPPGSGLSVVWPPAIVGSFGVLSPDWCSRSELVELFPQAARASARAPNVAFLEMWIRIMACTFRASLLRGDPRLHCRHEALGSA